MTLATTRFQSWFASRSGRNRTADKWEPPIPMPHRMTSLHKVSGEIMSRLHAIAQDLLMSSAKALAYCRAAGINARSAFSKLSTEDEARLRRYIETHPGMPEPNDRPGEHQSPPFWRRIAYLLLVVPVGLIIWIFGLWEDQNNAWSRFYCWLVEGSRRGER